jgi:hypothetical protein
VFSWPGCGLSVKLEIFFFFSWFKR